MAALMIEIPVHAEEGWSNPSTLESAPVRTRLEASLKLPKSPKSPDALRRAEEQAVLLRDAHIAAVASRAARESQRAEEARARRLRSEEAAHSKLQHRLAAAARRDARLTAHREARAAHKAAARESYAKSVRAARDAAAHERIAKANGDEMKIKLAAAKREKAIQATVEKNAQQVRKALAVAAAVKQLEREACALAASKLLCRLNAAAERRQDEMAARAKPAERATELAKTVAFNLSAAAVDLAAKKRQMEKDAERATDKRNEMIKHVVARAAVVNERVANAAQARAAAAADVSLRRNLFERLNAADHRRQIKQCPSLKHCASRNDKNLANKKHHPHGDAPQGSPKVISIQVHSEKLPLPPTQLVERLAVKSNAARTLKERHARAAARISHARLAKLKFALKCKSRGLAALAFRRAAAAALKSKIEERMLRAADVAAAATHARKTVAANANARVNTAAHKRAAACAMLRREAAKRHLNRIVAAGRRATLILSSIPVTNRHIAAAARRAMHKNELGIRASELRARCVRAEEMKKEILQRVADRAREGLFSGSNPAKATQQDGLALSGIVLSGNAFFMGPTPARFLPVAAPTKKTSSKTTNTTAKTITPTKPVTPTKATTPATPTTPTKATTPPKDTAPTKPTTPTKPTNPSNPITPTKATTPTKTIATANKATSTTKSAPILKSTSRCMTSPTAKPTPSIKTTPILKSTPILKPSAATKATTTTISIGGRRRTTAATTSISISAATDDKSNTDTTTTDTTDDSEDVTAANDGEEWHIVDSRAILG